MRSRGRRNVSLSDEGHLVLDQVGNFSEYVDKIIKQHAQDWTEALALLTAHGWRSAEILTACDVIAGYGLSNASRDGMFLSQELERAQEKHGVFTKREVSSARRQRCLKQLAEDRAIASALATVVREYLIPNNACQQAVEHAR